MVIDPKTIIEIGKVAKQASEVPRTIPCPASPPMTYCPSAPIFQTLARKPTESPMAIRISGAALMPRSCHLFGSSAGTKKMFQTAPGPS